MTCHCTKYIYRHKKYEIQSEKSVVTVVNACAVWDPDRIAHIIKRAMSGRSYDLITLMKKWYKNNFRYWALYMVYLVVPLKILYTRLLELKDLSF